MSEHLKSLRSEFVFGFILGVGLMIAWMTHSYFEAKAYTRLTGKPVSTWDAMWVDLQVVNN